MTLKFKPLTFFLFNVSFLPASFSFLQTVKCLLIVPNPASALNEEAGKLLLEHYEDYSRQAKMMTEIYALRQKSYQENKQKDEMPLDIGPSKKRPAEDAKKRKVDKKRALKRL